MSRTTECEINQAGICLVHDDHDINKAIKVLHDAGVRTAADYDRLMDTFERSLETLPNQDSPKLAGADDVQN